MKILDLHFYKRLKATNANLSLLEFYQLRKEFEKQYGLSSVIFSTKKGKVKSYTLNSKKYLKGE
ncbi:hypothetical protein [Helicobacter cetorum]|uniref:hypothetical protein n=1 Tax=Helicobacter cetorum TaxID=138563 RepID=UPI000CF0F113|nr:hypothetical protein [Helicobacter cetorum]